MEEEKTVVDELQDSLSAAISRFDAAAVGSEEREREARNIERLSNAIKEIGTIQVESEDRIEKRRIEEEKNASNAEIETLKAKTPWGRIFFEAGTKVFMQFVDHMFFRSNQRQVLDFEEHGIVRSKASKDLGFRFPWSKK